MLSIGIDDYLNHPRLQNAVNDALEASRLFRERGFEEVMPPLLDEQATAQAICALPMTLESRLEGVDSLVVMFSGHARNTVRVEGNQQLRTGALIPYDATEDPGTWIDLKRWLHQLAKLELRHLLVILDACGSGVVLDSVIRRHRGEAEVAWDAGRHGYASRRIIASARADQVARDDGPRTCHSVFAGCLFDALQGALPPKDGRVVTGTELGAYIEFHVSEHTNHQQIPIHGRFGSHDEYGEMPIPVRVVRCEPPIPVRGAVAALAAVAGGRGHALAAAAAPALVASAHKSLRHATEEIRMDTGRMDLLFTDDALALTRLGPLRGRRGELSVPVEIQRSYSPDHEVEGVFNESVLRLAREQWLTDYDAAAHKYVDDALESFARSGSREHDCKVGFVSFDAGLQTHGSAAPALSIRPVNNVVCEHFNLSVGRARADRQAPQRRQGVEAQWASWLRALLYAQSMFSMPCPSQLFLELLVVTSDGAIACPLKKSKNSVYAHRHDGRVKTVGFEEGFRWRDVVVGPAKGTARLDLHSALLHGLAREYLIRGAKRDGQGKVVGQNLPKGHVLYACAEQPLSGLFNLVVQGLHLNTAILGYCVLPMTQADLAKHLRSLQPDHPGGLDFTDVEFLPRDRWERTLRNHTEDIARGLPATEWHGTALMRLQMAVEHRETIDAACRALRSRRRRRGTLPQRDPR